MKLYQICCCHQAVVGSFVTSNAHSNYKLRKKYNLMCIWPNRTRFVKVRHVITTLRVRKMGYVRHEMLLEQNLHEGVMLLRRGTPPLWCLHSYIVYPLRRQRWIVANRWTLCSFPKRPITNTRKDLQRIFLFSKQDKYEITLYILGVHSKLLMDTNSIQHLYVNFQYEY